MKEKLRRQLEILRELAEMEELDTFAIYSKKDFDAKVKSKSVGVFLSGVSVGVSIICILNILFSGSHPIWRLW